ncbi:enoyl-CoA hydratase/isomerase family protein [Candidatus Sumerlaeota bacterium]|nr:enoyl-CoA hydratase/isomerase family protein [Candidatus Sumerlaeota bacterium]MBI3736402.1 enoyl-CoA hydratase/isomerase family protein [Candidatus Sumerlaeota bacterium]
MTASAGPKVDLGLDTREGQGIVATITVDHQARLNILNTPIMNQLIEILEKLKSNEDLRVVILTGAGDRSFIGGADINEMAGLDVESAKAFIKRVHGVCQGVRDIPVPVIARICGHCLGAGLEIAASCDLRIAADHSTFGMPEVRVGIPSVVEAALLKQMAGRGRAQEIIYTGEIIWAYDALSCGFIEHVAPKEKLDETIQESVAAMLKNGPRAMRLQKKLLRECENLPLDKAIELSIEFFAEAYKSDEPKTLMNNFLNRKKNSDF